MTRPRLLLDEMVSAKIAVRLRELGLDVSAVLEDRELVGTPDGVLLELAAHEGRILVTKNIVDFGPLSQQWAADGRVHAGLVFISTKTFPESGIGSVLSRPPWRTRTGSLGFLVQVRSSG